MGTETLHRYSGLFSLQRTKLVKLNNPQMGTETNPPCCGPNPQYPRFVKLNNPQMGTETAPPLEWLVLILC